MSLRLPRKHLWIPPEELEEVAGEREAWDSLLRLLSPRPNPGKTAEDGWMDGWMDVLFNSILWPHIAQTTEKL